MVRRCSQLIEYKGRGVILRRQPKDPWCSTVIGQILHFVQDDMDACNRELQKLQQL